eukprot:7690838-Heterocapsa_arctica.AAC.1
MAGLKELSLACSMFGARRLRAMGVTALRCSGQRGSRARRVQRPDVGASTRDPLGGIARRPRSSSSSSA